MAYGKKKSDKIKMISPSRSPKSLMPKKTGPISSIAKKAVKKAGSEGPKRSTPRKKK